MTRDEQYCDCCGKQMTYQDTDGETCSQGITLKTMLEADIEYRTSCGSRSSRSGVNSLDFCSVACFDLVVTSWVDKVHSAAKNMEPLK